MNQLQSQGQARPNVGTPVPQQPGTPAQGPLPSQQPTPQPGAAGQGGALSASVVSVTTTTTSWRSLRETKAEVAEPAVRQTQASFARPVVSRATRWVEQVLGREWATPPAESRPRALEVARLKPEQMTRWLASIHGDDKVSAADAAVMVTLLAHAGYDVGTWVEGRILLVDLLITLSLREPAQAPSDKTVAMFKALVHTMMHSTTAGLDPATPRPWPSPPLRMTLASHLAVPALSDANARHYYQERRGPALMQALVRALCPPINTHPQQIDHFLAGIDADFSPWPATLGRWRLAQGIEAVLSARALEKDPDTKQGGSGTLASGEWMLPPDAAMRLAPLAVPVTASRVMDQAHRVYQLHSVAQDSPATADAASAVLRERILTEGREWPQQVLIAAVCGYAAYIRLISFDQDSEAPQEELEACLAPDKAKFLQSPLAASASTRKAIEQGFALAAEPLRCLNDTYFDVDDAWREPLVTAALSLAPALSPASLLLQLDHPYITEYGPFVACKTIQSLLRFGMRGVDGGVLVEVRRTLWRHIDWMFEDMAEVLEEASDGGDQQAAHALIHADLMKVRTQEIPAIYGALHSQLRETWMAEAPAWTVAQRQEFFTKARGLALLLRKEADHWRNPVIREREIENGVSDSVRRVAQELEAFVQGLQGKSAATPDDGAPPAFDDALLQVGIFRQLMDSDSAKAQRSRAAILALLRAHDGLAVAPGRAAQVEPLLRQACDKLSKLDAAIAIELMVRLGGGAQLAADLLDKLVAIVLVRKAGMSQAQYAEQATYFLLGLLHGMLGSSMAAADRDEGADALATTVFLTSAVRHLARMADPAQRLALLIRFTDLILFQLAPTWQVMFLRELLHPALKATDGKSSGPGAPGVWVAQANFMAIATGLAAAHKGLNRQDWNLLLDHLLETTVSEQDLQRVCYLLLKSAHMLVAPPVDAGKTDPAAFAALAVRQLLERPAPIPALARVMRSLLGALGVESLPVAGKEMPGAAAKGALGPVLGRLVLAKIQSPEAAGRLMAAMTLALRETPDALAQLQQWLWDAVGALDAELVVAGMEDDDTARLDRLRADVMMRAAVLGAGHAFGVGWVARPAPDAAALRASLTAPAKAAVQLDVQAALWCGAQAVSVAITDVKGKAVDAAQAWARSLTRVTLGDAVPDGDDAVDDDAVDDDADAPPMGSKSRRVAGGSGRDRQDPADPGYSEKRKTRRPNTEAMSGSPLVMERLPVSAREIDALGDAPAPLRQALHAMLEAFGGEGTPKVPIARLRKALAEWLGPHAQFDSSAAAPASRRHPADAAAVGDLLERLFADTMARLDAWLQAQMAVRADLAPMAKSLADEIAQWRGLNTPHARRVASILHRVWEGLDTYLHRPVRR